MHFWIYTVGKSDEKGDLDQNELTGLEVLAAAVRVLLLGASSGLKKTAVIRIYGG